MAPSWVISTQRQVVARLRPDYPNKRFEIEIVSGVSKEELKEAAKGTVQNEQLVYELEGEEYRTPIRTLRGDYRDEEGNTRNQLRQWELHDFKPRPDDIFQERLYCIQWIKAESLKDARPATYFASVTEEDLYREREVERIVEENLPDWQEQGLVPDMPIESGSKTDEPIRTRGWRYWHHLFNPRQLLQHAITKKYEAHPISIAQSVNWNCKLSRWNRAGGGGGIVQDAFYNMALNTFYDYGCRSWEYQQEKIKFDGLKWFPVPGKVNEVSPREASSIREANEIFVTDPPYADAINYHEITEFFIAWLRKNPPAPFDQWTWDSRRSMAIKGTGDDFRRSMVEAYSAMAEQMPDNGLQCVMFTHKDTGVWGDMVSIFWAAGLQVVGAWYIATEASTAFRDGAHVQGTVLLMLRKRGEGGSGFRSQLLPQIRHEVANQVDQMMHLDERARAHGNVLFNDADLQMAGYAAALKVLTAYTRFDGKDVTALAVQPREKGESNPIDEIVDYARQVANNYLIPERLKELNPDTWQEGLTPAERFYLRLLSIEHTGQFKLENHQNFGRAFQVDPEPLMASRAADNAQLKGAADFRPRDLESGVLGGTNLGYVLIAIQELLNDGDPATLVGQIRAGLDTHFYQVSDHLIAIAQYIADMVANQRPEEADAAEILANRLRNERL